MKTTVKRAIRDEQGKVLILVLVLLVVGGLVLTPLLGLMSTGLVAGQVYEKKTDELYAADAGVEDAVWKIQQGEVPVCSGDPSRSYNISDVNGKKVEYTITYVDGLTYRVISTATGDGSGTEVEAYVIGASVCLNYSGILNQIITSQGEIDEKVTLNYSEGHEPEEYYEGAWPDTPEEIAQVAQWYKLDVKDETPYPSGTIDLNGVDMYLGPLYREGGLDIENSSNPAATLTLTDTIYITGKTTINPNHELILNLNGHTIFVESDSTGSGNEDKALYIGGKCTIEGPGIIIAIGDIKFEPNPDVGAEGEPVFIMSVEGTTTIRPGVNMYGAVAGSVQVGIQHGSNPIIYYPEEGFEGLNFPGLVEAHLVYSIYSWEIK